MVERGTLCAPHIRDRNRMEDIAMPSNDLAKLTKAQLIALLTVTQTAPSEASQHWAARDLAVTCCNKTFRVEGSVETGGRAFHLAKTHKNGKAK